MAVQIAADPASIALELAQGLTHALAAPGMAMTPGLGGETRSKPRVALAQLYPGFRDEFWPDRQRF